MMLGRHPVQMNEVANEHDRKTVYLTNEQIQRIGALSLDSLSGVQIHTTESDLDAALVTFVPIDDPGSGRLEHYVIFTDGSHRRET